MHTSLAAIRRARWTLPLVALATTAALGLSACGSSGSASSSAGLTKVTVRTDVFYTGADLPLLAGIQDGIYRKYGLDVSINPGTGSTTTLQTVANGSDDIGLADAGSLVQAAGKGMPVEMVAGIVQRSPLAVFTKAGSGITSVQQLAGKTGGYAIGSAPEMLFPAFAKAAGLNPDSVTFDKVDVPTRDSLFVQGKTQFTFGDTNVTTANIQAACKCELNTLSYADTGLDVLSTGVVTSMSYAKSNAATLRKFLAATAEAVNFSEKNTDTAINDFFKIAGATTLSKAVVQEQWEATEKLMTTTNTSGQPFGCTAEADWQSTIKLMEQFADVPAGKVTPASVGTNAYLSGCAGALGQA